ncbi:MAG TPA: glutamate synthase subunit alpha, partial [Acidimicrobiales bacterium]|nr:glutamate synthase subunit alpha [Acidimicrobiales bacterium]
MAALPEPAGLYDPANEHDACGIAFVAELRRGPSHAVVQLGLTALENLAHRGAFGADTKTGDGAGILVQLPDELFRPVAVELGIALPPRGGYGSGMVFLPTEAAAAARAKSSIGEIAASEGLSVLGWREVPVDLSVAGKDARAVAPRFAQIFVAPAGPAADPEQTAGSALAIERRLFVLRKRIEHEIDGVYLPSLSARTFVYKGMLA